MKILFIIQDYSTHLKDEYTDDVLMAEHLRLGDKVYAAEPMDITLEAGRVLIHVSLYRRTAVDVSFEPDGKLALSDFDYVYLRAMPPVEKNLLYLTYLLRGVRFCNHPDAIRDFNEKLIALRFSKYVLPTMITASREDIVGFAGEHKWPLILKPLDGYQALGVRKLERVSDIPELEQLMIVQPYLPAVEKTGSKRVFILKGKFIGAVSFLPLPGEFLTNFKVVHEMIRATLTGREQRVCADVGKFLVRHKINFAALDFIDEYLMEINITSPGGVPEYNIAYGGRLEEKIVAGLMRGIK